MKEWMRLLFLLTVVPIVSSIHERQREALPSSRMAPTLMKISNGENLQQYHTSLGRVPEEPIPSTSYREPAFVSEIEFMGPFHRQEYNEEMDDGIEAFVTSVANDEDAIDACVLARRSKGDSGVRWYPGDKEKNWKTLKGCGWDVLKFSLPSNQYIIETRRLEWLRIHSWALAEYKAVVYVEPNSLVISPSVEEMFRCGCFCASIYKGDYFEPDVMGLKPDASVYQHMLSTLEANTLGKKPQLVAWFNTYFKDLLMKPYFPLKVPAETVRCFSCEVKYFSICMRRLPVGYNADPVSHGIFLNSRLLRYKVSSLKPYKWWSAIFLSPHSRKIYLHYKRQIKNIKDINRSFHVICLFRVSLVASILLIVRKKWKCTVSKGSYVRWNSTLFALFLSYLLGPLTLFACITTSWLLVPRYCEYITGTLCFDALFTIQYFSLIDFVIHIYTSASYRNSQEETIDDTEHCLKISVPWMQREENLFRLWLYKLKILFIATFCIVPHIFIRFTRNIKALITMFVAYLLFLSFLSQLLLFLNCRQSLYRKLLIIYYNYEKETFLDPEEATSSYGHTIVTKKTSAILENPRYSLNHLNRWKKF
ncbi:Inositol phosphorylceramide glucuronosyltransferase 1 [Galdieria sulphuraria]|nr:Inositol phosphorylceramide glucuronosyltransferase 1 [Galdieria sulphuraria]